MLWNSRRENATFSSLGFGLPEIPARTPLEGVGASGMFKKLLLDGYC